MASLAAGDSGTTNRTWMGSGGRLPPVSAPRTMEKPQLAFWRLCRITVLGYWRLRGSFCQYILKKNDLIRIVVALVVVVATSRRPRNVWLLCLFTKLMFDNVICCTNVSCENFAQINIEIATRLKRIHKFYVFPSSHKRSWEPIFRYNDILIIFSHSFLLANQAKVNTWKKQNVAYIKCLP